MCVKCLMRSGALLGVELKPCFSLFLAKCYSHLFVTFCPKKVLKQGSGPTPCNALACYHQNTLHTGRYKSQVTSALLGVKPGPWFLFFFGKNVIRICLWHFAQKKSWKQGSGPTPCKALASIKTLYTQDGINLKLQCTCYITSKKDRFLEMKYFFLWAIIVD